MKKQICIFWVIISYLLTFQIMAQSPAIEREGNTIIYKEYVNPTTQSAIFANYQPTGTSEYDKTVQKAVAFNASYDNNNFSIFILHGRYYIDVERIYVPSKGWSTQEKDAAVSNGRLEALKKKYNTPDKEHLKEYFTNDIRKRLDATIKARVSNSHRFIVLCAIEEYGLSYKSFDNANTNISSGEKKVNQYFFWHTSGLNAQETTLVDEIKATLIKTRNITNVSTGISTQTDAYSLMQGATLEIALKNNIELITKHFGCFKQFADATGNCSKLVELFADAPEAFSNTLTDAQKWSSFETINNCGRANWTAKEYQAVANIFYGLSGTFLRDKIEAEKLLFRDLITTYPDAALGGLFGAFAKMGHHIWAEDVASNQTGIDLYENKIPRDSDVIPSYSPVSDDDEILRLSCKIGIAENDWANFSGKIKLGNVYHVLRVTSAYGSDMIGSSSLVNYDFLSPVKCNFDIDETLVLPAFLVYNLIERAEIRSNTAQRSAFLNLIALQGTINPLKIYKWVKTYKKEQKNITSGSATADELKYWNQYLVANNFTTATAPTTISLFMTTYREIKNTKGFIDINNYLKKTVISGDVFRLKILINYSKGTNDADKIARVKGLMPATNILLTPFNYGQFKKLIDDYLPYFRQNAISTIKPTYFGNSSRAFNDINMQHILDKHTAEHFDFTKNSFTNAQGVLSFSDIEFFPIGTTQQQVANYVDHALSKLKIQHNLDGYPLNKQPETVTLSPEMSVRIGSDLGKEIKLASFPANSNIIGMFYPIKNKGAISIGQANLKILYQILK